MRAKEENIEWLEGAILRVKSRIAYLNGKPKDEYWEEISGDNLEYASWQLSIYEDWKFRGVYS